MTYFARACILPKIGLIYKGLAGRLMKLNQFHFMKRAVSTITISAMSDEQEIEFLRDKASFNYTYDKATINSLKKHFALKDSLYLLAKNGDEFVAFCSTDKGWWEDNFFFLREILVDPKFQKLGLGKQLMSRCIEHAKAKGALGVVTETAFDNAPMQTLCAKSGFTKWENPQWKEGITYKLLFPSV
ncbi:MAG: GNAT family N-acetyltransferase [Parcubacteria group bacterium]|nr:GNAT family N-acetyltransferase [Parcubacteria group bacterium]